MEAVASEVLLPIGEIHFATSHAPFWGNGQLVKVLEEFGFQFSGPTSPEGLRLARLPEGWTIKGEAWVPNNTSSHRWWVVDNQGRRRIEIFQKVRWGYSETDYLMTIKRSSSESDDPRAGW